MCRSVPDLQGKEHERSEKQVWHEWGDSGRQQASGGVGRDLYWGFECLVFITQ